MPQTFEKVIIKLGIILTVVMPGLPHLEAKDTPRMWGDLSSGGYKVGFKTIFTYDQTRPAIPYSDWNGKLYPSKETAGRQMQINVWYPAEVNEDEEQIKYSYYLELMARQTDFGEINNQRMQFSDEQFISKTNALGGEGSFNIKKLDILKNLKTNAYLNAKHIETKFPLLVFPNGSSPASQSIMSEYFASHGFIVIGVALKGQHAYTEEASLIGTEIAVMDLNFALAQALAIPQVDKDNICLIGNAITSSQIVAFQTRNSSTDCIVSLDGGLLSQFEQNILNRTPFYKPEAMDKPILAIYATHPSIDPKHIDHLKFSDRYFFHFPEMSEFHFLNYGMFEQFVPNIIGKPKGDVQKGFEMASLYSLKFFEAFLNNNEESLEFLNAEPKDSTIIDKYSKNKAIPSPPNLTIVKDNFTKEGMVYIERTYNTLKNQNPQPFSRDFYTDLKDWLAWKKDPQYENRFRLYRLALDSYPESATINFHFAFFALSSNRYDLAKKHNLRTLVLLETDQSPELTAQIKAKMKEFIRQDLEALNNK